MLKKAHVKLIFAITVNVSIFSLVGNIVLIVLWHSKLTPFQDYALVIDAGSTHSKIFVYAWPADKSDGRDSTSRVQQVKSCSVSQEPITIVVNITQDNIKEYFDSAMTDCIAAIPVARKSRALIFLGATAGLRLAEIKNPSYISNLLNTTRNYFNTLGLLFRSPESQVRIIGGSEEGLSGWISTNILMRQLFEHDQPMETYGVSDMGGASTQLSFIAPNATSDHYMMHLFGIDYDVYSHSYLCYGQEQIRLIYLGHLVKQANGSFSIDDVCLQDGYIENKTYDDLFSTACARNQYAPPTDLNTSAIFTFIGTGEYKECKTIIEERFNNSFCSSSTCSFNNIYQPVPISLSLKFIAISGWYSTINQLAPYIPLQPDKNNNYNFSSVNLTEIKHAIKTICNESWSHVHKPDEHRPFLCFHAVYDWTLFEHGYHMTDDNLPNFQIIKKIDSTETGWTLGYMINQTNYLDPESRPTPLLTQGEFIGLLILCLLCLIISSIIVGTIIYFYKKRPRESK